MIVVSIALMAVAVQRDGPHRLAQGLGFVAALSGLLHGAFLGLDSLHMVQFLEKGRA